MMVRTNRTIKGIKLMTAKKLNLDIVKDSEIEHDKTFIDAAVMVFSREDPKKHKVLSYSALTHQGEFFIPVADGPEAQSFLEGSCFILLNKGKVVAIGKGHRYLKVDGKNIITHSIRERYKRISKTKEFKDAYVNKSIGETIKVDEPAQPTIVIHNDIDPVTELYDPNGKLIGQIRNCTALSDVCVQIHKKKLAGYYIMYKGQKLKIFKNGNIRPAPKGFYDAYTNNSLFVFFGGKWKT